MPDLSIQLPGSLKEEVEELLHEHDFLEKTSGDATNRHFYGRTITVVAGFCFLGSFIPDAPIAAELGSGGATVLFLVALGAGIVWFNAREKMREATLRQMRINDRLTRIVGRNSYANGRKEIRIFLGDTSTPVRIDNPTIWDLSR